jgi:hypothetical protein
MPKHDVSIVKWLIAAGTVTGTLAGWMTLASGASAATSDGAAGLSDAAWQDVLQNPLPTLASANRTTNASVSTAVLKGQSTATLQPTLRSVKQPTVAYVSSGGGSGGKSAPVTSTRTSKPK